MTSVDPVRNATARAIDAVGAIASGGPVAVIVRLQGLQELIRIPMSRSFVLLFDALVHAEVPVVLVGQQNPVWWLDRERGWRGDSEVARPAAVHDVVARVQDRMTGARTIIVSGDPVPLASLAGDHVGLVVSAERVQPPERVLWVPGVIALRTVLWWLVGARPPRRVPTAPTAALVTPTDER